jgi:prepilin peptidase CpaA
MADAVSAIVLLRPGILALVATLLVIACLNDIAVRTIPDLASLGVVVLGIAVRLGDGAWAAALAVSAAVFVFGAIFWRFGWLGGGDVKLLAACALLVPPSQVPQLVLLTALAGGVLACVYLVLSGVAWTSRRPTSCERPQSLLGRIGRVELWRIRRRAGLPYGCAIAIATLLTLSTR